VEYRRITVYVEFDFLTVIPVRNDEERQTVLKAVNYYADGMTPSTRPRPRRASEPCCRPSRTTTRSASNESRSNRRVSDRFYAS
jgi:hypothetical protein